LGLRPHIIDERESMPVVDEPKEATMSVSVNIHPTSTDAAPTGSVTTNEHEHSDGPYAVLKFAIGGFDVTAFPKDGNVQALGELLSELGAELLRLAPIVAPKVAALTE